MGSETPSAQQLRAAIGMLGIDYRKFSALSGVTVDTISRICLGKHDASPRINAKMRQALEAQGIEFLGFDGVRRRPEGINVLTGARAVYDFLDDVYATVINGGEICVTGVDEMLFDKHYQPGAPIHRDRMTALRERISMRCILREGDVNFTNSGYIEYRWMDGDKFDASAMYAYNHKVAFLELAGDVPIITIFESPAIAGAFRKQFDFIWQHCKVPPVS